MYLNIYISSQYYIKKVLASVFAISNQPPVDSLSGQILDKHKFCYY